MTWAYLYCTATPTQTIIYKIQSYTSHFIHQDIYGVAFSNVVLKIENCKIFFLIFETFEIVFRVSYKIIGILHKNTNCYMFSVLVPPDFPIYLNRDDKK